MRERKEEGKREARLNSPELNQQIKVKGARTAAPIIRRPFPSVERAGPNNKQQATSIEQRATSNEQRATNPNENNNESRATIAN